MSRIRKDSSPSSFGSGTTTSSLQIANSTSSSTPNSATVSTISLLREDLRVEDEFEILKVLHKGSFSTKIVLATIKKDVDRTKVIITSRSTNPEDFNRQFEITHLLSPHPSIVTCYNVAFLWDGLLCFLQEYAVYGSIFSVLQKRKSGTLNEQKTKLVCSQIASALEFMHHLYLVHGRVTPDNILVFKRDLTKVKLADFSSSRTEGSLVVIKIKEKPETFDFFSPPELSDLLPQEKFNMSSDQDVWHLGMLAFYLMEGKGPWRMADALADPIYRQYCLWMKRKNLKVPETLRNYAPRFLRLFKRLCDPKPAHRSSVREIHKYLKDSWLLRTKPIQVLNTKSRSSGTIGQDTASTTLSDSYRKLSLEDQQVDKTKVLQDWIQTTTTTTTLNEI